MSGVVRELRTAEEMEGLAAAFDRIWGGDARAVEVPLLLALAHGGSYVTGVEVDGRLVGGCMAFFVEPLGRTLHSHIAGVVPEHAGTGLGRALKLHQREWARERGLDTIQWTFDPLVARNAYFNVARLGAAPREYLPCFYGAMRDGINAGDESDRLLVSWDVSGSGSAPGDTAPVPGDAARRVARGADGRPVVDLAASGTTVTVAVPADVERLRGEDPEGALAWRHAVRDALAPLVGSDAWRGVGFDPDAGYVFRRARPTDSPEEP